MNKKDTIFWAVSILSIVALPVIYLCESMKGHKIYHDYMDQNINTSIGILNKYDRVVDAQIEKLEAEIEELKRPKGE